MEQPQFPKSSSKPPNSTSTPQIDLETIRQKMNFPTSAQIISHYESQGMSPYDASVKAIDDLQYMIFKVAAKNKGAQDKSIIDASRKLDTCNARLSVIEMKLDTKPGYPQSVAIAIGSAAAFRGIAAVWPHLVSATASVWNSVRGSTNT